MIKRLRLSNFRRHEETEIHFPESAQLVLISGVNGAGKCLPGDVRIYDGQSGQRVKIKDFVQEKGKTTLGFSDKKTQRVDVTAWHSLGEKEIFLVELENGARIKAAKTHPFLTKRGCVKVEDLTLEDSLGEALNFGAGRAFISEKEAFLLGKIYAKNALENASTNSLSNTESADASVLERALKDVFPLAALEKGEIVSSLSKKEKEESLKSLLQQISSEKVNLLNYFSPSSAQELYSLREDFKETSHNFYEGFKEIENDYAFFLDDLLGLWTKEAISRWLLLLGVEDFNALPSNVSLFEKEARAFLVGLGLDLYSLDSGSLDSGSLDSGSLDLNSSDPGSMPTSNVNCKTSLSSPCDGFTEEGVSFTHPSYKLLQDVRGLLLSLGYKTSIKTDAEKTSPKEMSTLFTSNLFISRKSSEAVYYTQVKSISLLGKEECFDITVDTQEHLYLAETFVVHNSSLLEGILMGLYGESRHGKRNLDALVKRGRELEGMEVEVDFTIQEAEYSVKRKRVNKLATAVLYGNGMPLVEGTREVSQEVAKIIGMDAMAFRLAVIAQQKELDGLASLRPAERSAQLSRLLRLDAVTRAKDEARGVFRSERDVVKGIGTLDDIDVLKENLFTLEAKLKSSQIAFHEASSGLLELDSLLAASSSVDMLYSQAVTALAEAQGMKNSALREAERIEQEVKNLFIPSKVAESKRTLEELALLATNLEREIAKGEAAREVKSQKAMLTSEKDRVTEKLKSVTQKLEENNVLILKEELLNKKSLQEKNKKDLNRLQEEFTSLREENAFLQANKSMLENKQEALEKTGPVCDNCGQDVDESYQEEKEAFFIKNLEEATKNIQTLFVKGNDKKEEVESVKRLILQTEKDLSATSSLLESLKDLSEQKEELSRRFCTYEAQIARLEVKEVDLEDLYAQKAEIAIEVAHAQQANEALRERERVLSKKFALDFSLIGAQERLKEAVEKEESALVDADLKAAYEERRSMAERRKEEQELLHYFSQENAVMKEKFLSAKESLEKAEKMLVRRREHESKAQTAANANKVLGVVEDILNTQIRPALEGSVSEVLATLSEGRFEAVKVDQDYNITVHDDGNYRPLSELSGGELDLVALAVRLALAGVVTDRSGGGAGFLILDECFGSQDGGRREAILSALRNLRSTYQQILIISHVGGLEDSADMVIEVKSEEDEEGMRMAVVKS